MEDACQIVEYLDIDPEYSFFSVHWNNQWNLTDLE